MIFLSTVKIGAVPYPGAIAISTTNLGLILEVHSPTLSGAGCSRWRAQSRKACLHRCLISNSIRIERAICEKTFVHESVGK